MLNLTSTKEWLAPVVSEPPLEDGGTDGCVGVVRTALWEQNSSAQLRSGVVCRKGRTRMLWQGCWPRLSADFLWHTTSSPCRRKTETLLRSTQTGVKWGGQQRKVRFVYCTRMNIFPRLKTHPRQKYSLRDVEKLMPYISRHGTINKMFFYWY